MTSFTLRTARTSTFADAIYYGLRDEHSNASALDIIERVLEGYRSGDNDALGLLMEDMAVSFGDRFSICVIDTVGYFSKDETLFVTKNIIRTTSGEFLKQLGKLP